MALSTSIGPDRSNPCQARRKESILARRPLTSAAILLTVMFVIAPSLAKRDLINIPISIASNRLDDFLAVVTVILIGLAFDSIFAGARRRREMEIREQRLRVLKATMRTVQNIVNNSLNNLQLFRIEAEGLLPPESLRAFDRIVKQTSAELRHLGDLTSTPEVHLATGVGIEFHVANDEQTDRLLASTGPASGSRSASPPPGR